GEDVVGEGLLHQPVAADAGAPLGQEADVVVLGAAVPVRGQGGEHDAGEQPGGANGPGTGSRQTAEGVKHAEPPPCSFYRAANSRLRRKDTSIIGGGRVWAVAKRGGRRVVGRLRGPRAA